jgi:hypothetical protein
MQVHDVLVSHGAVWVRRWENIAVTRGDIVAALYLQVNLMEPSEHSRNLPQRHTFHTDAIDRKKPSKEIQ